MDYVKTEPLSLTGNLAENWRITRESYNIYMGAARLTTTTNN